MKKNFMTVLAFSMMLCVTACGSEANNQSADMSNTVSGLQETNEENTDVSGEVASEADESDAEETAESTGEAQSSFDTSWAGNDFERLLPELPFTGWTTEAVDDSVYEMQVLGLNTSAATNPPGSGESDGADKDKLIAYLDSLPAYGFTVEEKGQDYMWLVTDSKGNRIEFKCGDGGCWITITVVGSISSSSDLTTQTEADESESFTDERLDLLPEFPDAEWEVSDVNEDMTVMNAYGVDQSFVNKCLEAFQNTEYSLVDESSHGNYQYWEYESVECSIVVMFNSSEGYVGLEIHW